MVKIAMIGTSAIAEKFATATKYDERCELEIIYSRTMKKAQEFKEKFKVNQATDQFEELLNSNVDFIYIATPNKIHYNQVKCALEHNINVMVEKPITLNYKEIKELYQIAAARNLILIEAVKTMCMNTYQGLKDNLDLIGTIKHVELNIMREYGNYPTTNSKDNANIYKLELDGGVVNDLGSYVMYPIADLFNYQYDIKTTFIKENYLDVVTEIHAKLKTAQLTCEINLSMKNQGKNISVITGSKGYVTIDSMSQFNEVVFYEKTNVKIKEITKNHHHLMEREIKHMNDLILARKSESQIYTKELACRAQVIINQINASTNIEK